MQITQLDALTYVGPQISVANLDELKRLNIRTVIVARPEGETADQPTISALRDAAGALGITVHQIPVVFGNISDDDVRAYGAITSAADHPVFAYCRSGLRATTLWALSAAEQGHTPDEILRMAKAAGFDLSALAGRLAAQAA
ncbi:TIGR01244 family phosphatase [Sulfitobacter sp. SK012]|uniref:TIGR01244 family sulfur transferase n=1 Tax=Sulfitobacter sp. SK012 TaxID=1389005 RepID=UPI000E0C265C|nr:TIGR01244 family sulfur transferase [Sulfitobacter sp. SK012]AXI47879.1 TIGR01244 family phosphatase [Sulfitobacter sp. SK012]